MFHSRNLDLAPHVLIYQCWLMEEVPIDWRLASMTPIYKKGWKDDPGSYRHVSLAMVPGKDIEHIIWSAIMQLIQDDQGIRPS
ncbi:hypothetical protein BTVI_42695 [Pitangus sulphuratus]|nr:hypothetical protein BTVI_42695 [Pitangus sulphuratus]